jgi:hypothetical protein
MHINKKTKNHKPSTFKSKNYIQKQKPSTFKSKSKNLQHPRTKVKTFNIQEQM